MSLTSQAFDPHLGEVFDLAIGEHSLPLRLAEIERLGASGRDGGSFSLLFLGPQQPVLRQAVYPLQRDGLGRIEMFIVPLGFSDHGMRYQAVFN